MRVLGLAFAVLLAVTVPIAADANGPRSNMGPANSGPAPGIVLAWDGGGYRQPPNSRSLPPMEWRRARASLGAERLSFWLGPIWLARCPNVLGVGTQWRRLRLSLRRLARPDGRVG
jgi:hypothetical protein